MSYPSPADLDYAAQRSAEMEHYGNQDESGQDDRVFTMPRDPRRDGPWTVYAEMQTPTGLAVVETVVEGEARAFREMRDLEDGGFNAACWPTDSPDN